MGKISSSYDNEMDVRIYTVEGEITYEELRDEIDLYYKGKPTKYTLWDFTAAKMNLSSDDVKKLASQVRVLGVSRSGGADALVVPDILLYGLARMYSSYTEVFSKGEKPLKTGVFRTQKDAISWIKIQSAAS